MARSTTQREQPGAPGAAVPAVGIHATNAWNPTGRPLRPVPGCRLYSTHIEGLGGARTYVFLGSQHHLSFVGDLQGHLSDHEIRGATIAAYGLYPHLVDLDPAPELPRVFSEDQPV